jgi:hypothetical protein
MSAAIFPEYFQDDERDDSAGAERGLQKAT